MLLVFYSGAAAIGERVVHYFVTVVISKVHFGFSLNLGKCITILKINMPQYLNISKKVTVLWCTGTNRRDKTKCAFWGWAWPPSTCSIRGTYSERPLPSCRENVRAHLSASWPPCHRIKSSCNWHTVGILKWQQLFQKTVLICTFEASLK